MNSQYRVRSRNHIVLLKRSLTVPDVVVSVAQELSENVDGQDTEGVVRWGLHDSKHSLVENRVANILARLGVGCNL